MVQHYVTLHATIRSDDWLLSPTFTMFWEHPLRMWACTCPEDNGLSETQLCTDEDGGADFRLIGLWCHLAHQSSNLWHSAGAQVFHGFLAIQSLTTQMINYLFIEENWVKSDIFVKIYHIAEHGASCPGEHASINYAFMDDAEASPTTDSLK